MLVVGSNQDNEAIYVISVPLASCDFISHAQHSRALRDTVGT